MRIAKLLAARALRLQAVGLVAVGCRFGYEQLELGETGVPGSGASAGAAQAGGSTSAGGEPVASGGAGAAPTSGTGNDAGSGVVPRAGADGAGGADDVVGAGGAPSGVPPDSALCIPGMYGGHDYLLCAEERSWQEANAGCMAIGMRLVRIDDAAENQWVFDNVNVPGGAPPDVWIGATDAAVEGEWRWTDGDQFWAGLSGGTPQNGLFTAWNSREPNTAIDDEDCAAMLSNTPEWLDARCFTPWPYVCESL
jgi:hypothetical protein